MPCYKTLQQECWLHGKLPISMQGELGSPLSLRCPAVGGMSRGSLKDTEMLLMWSGQCWRDLAAHTAIASQSRIPQEIPVLWNICQASSTPRVISSPAGWKGQMCLWCNCSEASRDLPGTRSPGRSVTALPHSAAGGNPTIAHSSECLLLNWPKRPFWTEIHVCLGTEGWHLGFPLFPFRHALPQSHSRSSPSGRVSWQRLSSSRGWIPRLGLFLFVQGLLFFGHPKWASTEENPPLRPWHCPRVLIPPWAGAVLALPSCWNAAHQESPHPHGQMLLQGAASSQTAQAWPCCGQVVFELNLTMSVAMGISCLAVLPQTRCCPCPGLGEDVPMCPGLSPVPWQNSAVAGEARLTCSLWDCSMPVNRAVHSGTALSCLNGSSTHRAAAPGLGKDCWELTSSI